MVIVYIYIMPPVKPTLFCRERDGVTCDWNEQSVLLNLFNDKVYVCAIRTVSVDGDAEALVVG